MTIKEIREEIFSLAKQSPDLETMHWYTSLDECFENDEFQESEMASMKWRTWVLHQKKEPINRLLQMLDEIVMLYLTTGG